MNLRELLKSKRWNGSTLARELNTSSSVVNYWLNGKTEPNAEYIKQIAELCEVESSVVVDAILETKKQAKVG